MSGGTYFGATGVALSGGGAAAWRDVELSLIHI